MRVYWKNPRTRRWHLVKNSHWAMLSGTCGIPKDGAWDNRGAAPSRTMRWEGHAREVARSIRRQGLKVRVRK